ncbi:DUF5336 domain-containing protein [Mycobacterium sp. SMC-4]|uniref:DUF5336 domain-containing protein n=1 Tax=Mycobacterium sp. SMC-4 TaxID=2857059 RepID=UPI003D062E37
MSFPQGPPGGPGYPPAQQPTTQFTAPTQQFAKVPDQDFGAPAGTPAASKLPLYLTAAVAVLGLLVYLSSFAPQFTMSASDFPMLGEISGSSIGLALAVIASLVAALLAGISLLPKQRSFVNIAAVAAVLSFLLVVAEVVNKPGNATVDWGLYLVIAFTLLQAAVAVVTLLFESGIIKAPVPRPKYDQNQSYGQYPGSYYGQPPGQPQHQQQRPGYPTPYGGSGGYPSTGQSTGGFPASPQGQSQQGQSAQGQSSSGQQPSGPPTPPTGFPTYGQPPSGSNPGTQHPPSSSSQSGQSSS